MRSNATLASYRSTAASRGGWMVIFAAVLWGTTGTAQAFAPQGAQPAAVGAVRLAIGGMMLLFLAAVRGAFKDGQPWPLLDTGLAALSVAAYQPLFFGGVARTGVAVGTLVGIGSAPILAGLTGYLVRNERPGRRWGLATLLGVAGCGLLVATSRDVSVDSRGILLALGAGATYAFYTTFSKNLLAAHAPDAVMGMVFGLGGAALIPLLLVTDLRWLGEARGWLVALHLGLIATAAAYILFGRGLAKVPVATAVTLSLAEPLTAGALGVLVLGERLTPPASAGIGLLLAGLVLLARGAGRAEISSMPSSR